MSENTKTFTDDELYVHDLDVKGHFLTQMFLIYKLSGHDSIPLSDIAAAAKVALNQAEAVERETEANKFDEIVRGLKNDGS